MTNVVDTAAASPLLILSIDALRPIGARDVARFLNAVASDYRKANPRCDLVIENADASGYTFYFRDPRRSQPHALVEFAGLVSILGNEVLMGKVGPKFSGAGRELGSRTVHDLIKLSYFTKSAVELRTKVDRSEEVVLQVPYGRVRPAMKAIAAAKRGNGRSLKMAS